MLGRRRRHRFGADNHQKRGLGTSPSPSAASHPGAGWEEMLSEEVLWLGV